MSKFDDIYSNLLVEFLGFGKKQEDKPVGVKFTSLLAKGLMTKGFKRNVIGNMGYQFTKDNGHGMRITISMSDNPKEADVSVNVKYGTNKELYKHWKFVSHQTAFPYRKDPTGLEYDEKKKVIAQDQEWEDEQRKKVGQIYDIVALFDKADVPKLQSMMQQ